MEAPEKSHRSRNASGSAHNEAENSADCKLSALCQREGKSGLGTCSEHIAAAERLLATSRIAPNYFSKPSVLDSCDDQVGPVIALVRDLAFDNDAVAELGIRIQLPANGEIRARKLISRSRRVMTGKYPSWKMRRLIHWESRLESKVFRLLDVCPGVKKFSEQPFTIHYVVDGCWYAHVPDVAFLTCDGTLWILEIKSELDRGLADALARAEVITPRLKCLGFNYAVVKQRDIAAGTSLCNAETLLRFGRAAPSVIAHQTISRMLGEQSSLSREDVVGHVIDGKHAFHVAAQLALRGGVSLNWGEANHKHLNIQSLREENTKESLSWLQRALGVTK